MKKRKQKTIKPLDNFHLHFLFSGFLVVLPLNLLLLTGVEDYLALFVTIMIIDLVILLVYIITRIIYPAKYEIKDGYLTKYRSKKKIFQIKVQDIEAIYIKRGKWYSLLVFFIQTIFATLAEEDTMSSFSIVFKRCEIIKTEKRDTVSPSLKGNSCPDMFEHCDIMSVRKCKKLCKMIGVIPRFVDR